MTADNVAGILPGGLEPISEAFLASLIPYAGALLASSLLAARLLWSLRSGMRQARGGATLSGAEGGASVVEFALALPLLLTLLLLTLQIALLVQAKFVVNYAAFAAARSAIVTIPARIYSTRTGRYERANKLHLNNRDSPKMGIIRRAAALPCAAISPVISPSVLLATGLPSSGGALNAGALETLVSVAALFPATADGRLVGAELLKRAPYSYDERNTSVEVLRAAAAGRDFSDHEPITVRVRYRYYLTVPAANWMLGKPYYGGGFISRSGYYYEVVEQYTLPLEGEPLFPPGQEPSDKREVETEIYN